MRILLLLMMVLPGVVAAQSGKTSIYIRLTDASGKQLNGDVTARGFEKALGAFTVTPGGKLNEQLTFTMSINSSAADLKRAMTSGARLSNGQVTLVQPNPVSGMPIISYMIKMEDIRVVTCLETTGCDNNPVTMVTLQATRIGWIYYARGVVSKKYGVDTRTGGEWTGF